MMCHKKCQCTSKCDPQSGECLSENVQIVFDVAHNRTSGIMKLSSDRIQAKHWIAVSGNGKINFRNCSDPDQCEWNEETVNESTVVAQVAIKNDEAVNKTALLQELNSNLSNLTKELQAASDKSVVIVNSSIAIHHIHKGGDNDAGIKQKLNDPLTSSTETNLIETENIIDGQDNKLEDDEHKHDHGQHQQGDSDEIDSIGGFNDIVHVFAMNSINTTKSVKRTRVPTILLNL